MARNRAETARFRRVDPSKVQVDWRFKSNRFVDKTGSDPGSYGFKAHRDFSQVKGRDFRHEKNKKKRGSYKGGSIDISGVHSTKFDG